jgi:hypothetical protein
VDPTCEYFFQAVGLIFGEFKFLGLETSRAEVGTILVKDICICMSKSQKLFI